MCPNEKVKILKVLAHRGLWRSSQERNTRLALATAFQLGFGAETDIRDRGSQLVVSHDMAGNDAWPITDLLDDYVNAGAPGQLALNIKADGLAEELELIIESYIALKEKIFVFDMAVPDMLNYARTSIPFFTRYSEYETAPVLEGKSHGIWMDCLSEKWVQPCEIAKRLHDGQRIAVVSPELHGRMIHQEYWKKLKQELLSGKFSNIQTDMNLMLCTDFPELAADFFK